VIFWGILMSNSLFFTKKHKYYANLLEDCLKFPNFASKRAVI